MRKLKKGKMRSKLKENSYMCRSCLVCLNYLCKIQTWTTPKQQRNTLEVQKCQNKSIRSAMISLFSVCPFWAYLLVRNLFFSTANLCSWWTKQSNGSVFCLFLLLSLWLPRFINRSWFLQRDASRVNPDFQQKVWALAQGAPPQPRCSQSLNQGLRAAPGISQSIGPAVLLPLLWPYARALSTCIPPCLKGG